MATLNESAVWEDGIYQLEVSDPVLGGPGVYRQPAGRTTGQPDELFKNTIGKSQR